jgi:hypothetical protein
VETNKWVYNGDGTVLYCNKEDYKEGFCSFGLVFDNYKCVIASLLEEIPWYAKLNVEKTRLELGDRQVSADGVFTYNVKASDHEGLPTVFSLHKYGGTVFLIRVKSIC